MEDAEQLEEIRMKLEEVSGLKFTSEPAVDNKLPFLDIMVENRQGCFVTDVYRKPTSSGSCMNAASECPDRYKEGVIRTYVRRAVRTCSSWPLVNQELQRIRQFLVNNGYTNTAFDRVCQEMISKYRSSEDIPAPGNRHENDIRLFYKSTMTPAWKKDEKAIRSIVLQKCKPRQPDRNLTLTIYYQSPKTSSLVLQNNLQRDSAPLKQANLVYQFTCTYGNCATRTFHYIGYTTTSLSRRLTMHLQNGGPKEHFKTYHNLPITRDILVAGTKILARCDDRRRLPVLEAVFIREIAPEINIQCKQLGTLALYENK